MSGEHDGPADPMTALAGAAAQAHEFYTAHVNAGFTDEQALYLTAAVMTAGLRPQPPQP